MIQHFTVYLKNSWPCYFCDSLGPPFVLTSFPSLLPRHLVFLSLLFWPPALPVSLLHMQPLPPGVKKDGTNKKTDSSVVGMLRKPLSITSNITGVTVHKDHLSQCCFPSWVPWMALDKCMQDGVIPLVTPAGLVCLTQQWKTLASRENRPRCALKLPMSWTNCGGFPHCFRVSSGLALQNADL